MDLKSLGYNVIGVCLFQLLSKGKVFKVGSQTVSPSTLNRLSITVDSVLAQKLAPNARIVVWYITERGEIVSDSLDFTVNGAFANEVNNCILYALCSCYCFQGMSLPWKHISPSRNRNPA